MTLIDLLELLKLVTFVCVTKQAAVGADCNLARLAEVVKSGVVLGAQLLLPRLILRLLLLHHVHNIGKEAAWNELVGAERGSAVRALWPCLLDPLTETVHAAKLRAVGTHDCILNRTKADEAIEEFVKHRGICSPRCSIVASA